MTDAEIEYLKKRVRAGGGNVRLRARLLEERERLLEALRAALCDEGGFACPTATEESLLAAIAFAEAPASKAP